MIASMRACVCGALGLFVAACSDPQNRANVPDQPQSPDGTAVIVLGGPTAKAQPEREPLAIASESPPVMAKRAAAQPTTDADLAMRVRDSRKTRWSPRPTQLLVTELQSLEALHANTPANSPDKPRILRRLAEDYIELKNGARRDREDKERALGLSGVSPRQPAAETARLDKVILYAQAAALKYYQQLVNNHSTFCQSSHPTDPTQNHGCLDDVLYPLALEFQEMGKLDEARKHYLNLIKNFPQSRWVPYAYLGFGELFFAEAVVDPSKLDLAQKTYEQVLKSPAPQNDVFGFTHYRLAQIHHQKQDEAAALAHFVQAIDFSMKFAGLASSKPLGDIARRAIVPSYAAAGIPRKAEAFFARLTSDPSGTKGQVTNMLDELVQIYLRDNKRVEAGEVCYAFSGGAGAIAACGSITSGAF